MSGRASASDSKVVTSFLEGRRRLRGLEWDLAMRERKVEDLIWRFWILLEGKVGVEEERVDGMGDGAEGVVLAVRARMEGRFLGAVGACDAS